MSSYTSEQNRQIDEFVKEIEKLHNKHGDLFISAMTKYTNRIKELKRRRNKIAELNEEIEKLTGK